MLVQRAPDLERVHLGKKRTCAGHQCLAPEPRAGLGNRIFRLTNVYQSSPSQLRIRVEQNSNWDDHVSYYESRTLTSENRSL